MNPLDGAVAAKFNHVGPKNIIMKQLTDRATPIPRFFHLDPCHFRSKSCMSSNLNPILTSLNPFRQYLAGSLAPILKLLQLRISVKKRWGQL